MIAVQYSAARNLFWVRGPLDASEIMELKEAGFEWHSKAQAYCTWSPYRAIEFWGRCEPDARERLRPIMEQFATSFAADGGCCPPAPEGRAYRPFQAAGIGMIVEQFVAYDEHAVLLADPMGLGKTIQAIGTINYLGLDPSKVLIVGPASLRPNWERELTKWMVAPCRPCIISSGASVLTDDGPVVISYDLIRSPKWHERLMARSWELVIVDECQALKTAGSLRFKAVAGSLDGRREGVASRARRALFMSGTPAPNRPHEFYPLIRKFRPDIIDHYGYDAFMKRFLKYWDNGFGYRVTGVKRPTELALRLRGSGFMIRREKVAVLPQLPPKRHNMVVFPVDGRTSKVIAKEAGFDPKEIIAHGRPANIGALPDVRREMGIAKLPVCLEWIKAALDDDHFNKAVIFAHHVDVTAGLVRGLADYNPAAVLATTRDRMTQVDKFQTDATCRVLIGSPQPAGTGWTMTAAHTVIFVEASWVPSENEQCIDRCHRIGQEAESVDVYYLVVERSLDATILGAAADKAADLAAVVDSKVNLAESSAHQ